MDDEIMAARDVGVIIVNWNCSSDTLACSAKLRILYPKLTQFIVDNGSEPSDLAALQAAVEPPAEVVLSVTNGGYAQGVNLGILRAKRAGLRWAWLINPDSQPHEGCLELMLARSRGAVALSPAQFSSAHPSEAGATYTSAALLKRGRVTPLSCSGCPGGEHRADVLSGTGLLIDVSAAYGLGLFREGYFHYKEEFDLTERMGRLGELRLVCVARFWHRRGGSLAHTSPTAEYYRIRNELLYLRNRSGQWWLHPRTARFVLRTLFLALRGVPSTGKYLRAARVRGIADGLRGVGGPAPRSLA